MRYILKIKKIVKEGYINRDSSLIDKMSSYERRLHTKTCNMCLLGCPFIRTYMSVCSNLYCRWQRQFILISSEGALSAANVGGAEIASQKWQMKREQHFIVRLNSDPRPSAGFFVYRLLGQSGWGSWMKVLGRAEGWQTTSALFDFRFNIDDL